MIFIIGLIWDFLPHKAMTTYQNLAKYRKSHIIKKKKKKKQ